MFSSFDAFLQAKFFGNHLQDIFMALGIFFGIYLIIFLTQKLIEPKLRIAVEKTETKVDDVIFDALAVLVNIGGVFLALFIAKSYLQLPEHFNQVMDTALGVIGTVIITWVIQHFFSALLDQYFKKLTKAEAKTLLPLLKMLLNIFIWLISAAFILSNLGYQITSLATGLGIGGVAIALAVKPTLESFFASISIFADRPFQIGDFIKADNISGTVETIGLRTTTIRTTTGTELIVPNVELTNTKIENVAKRNGHRFDGNVGLVYGTTAEKIEKSIVIIQDILKAHPMVNDEETRVWFDRFGDFSLIISFTYFVDAVPPYVERLEAVSEINLSIKKGFEKAKIDMAFPTQVVKIEK